MKVTKQQVADLLIGIFKEVDDADWDVAVEANDDNWLLSLMSIGHYRFMEKVRPKYPSSQCIQMTDADRWFMGHRLNFRNKHDNKDA